MVFVLVGVLVLALKWLGWEPVASWSWLWVLSPFGMAVAWWAIADASGFTQRQAMKRAHARTVARREKALDDLGLRPQPKASKGRPRGRAEGGAKAGASSAGSASKAPLAERREPGGPV
jgi:small Trp-rich protein